ncbi:hypothetical protein LJR039_000948 [Pseudorhodoferax sp. LjRoot39]|uniref:hypothetical protein n=1 Tax=Pseudorhodoferax sp. LjRoot39 TaxID=3342328 RepID=UPI003ECD11DE
MTKRIVPPPDGFSSWLLYAIQTFDASGAANTWFLDHEPPITSDDIRFEIWCDFNMLRIKAGLAPLVGFEYGDQLQNSK